MLHPILAAVGSLSVFLSVAPAQSVRITNMADVPRKQWVDIAVPWIDGVQLPDACRLTPYQFPVRKGAAVGLHTQMFHALVDVRAGESLTGEIVPVGDLPPDEVFVGSDWVDDDPESVWPRVRVMKDGVEYRADPFEVQKVEKGPAREVLHLRSRIAGTPLVLDQWIYQYALQDIVKFEMTLTNSDPRTSDLSYTFDYLWVECSDYVSCDYRNALGMPPPARQDFMPWHSSYGDWFQLLSWRRVMGRGEQLFFTGAVFAEPRPGQPLQELEFATAERTITQTLLDRSTNFVAESRAPVVAVCTDWDGKWLAFGVAPEVPVGAGDGWGAADSSAAAFRERLGTAGDIYDQRPRGLNRHAGSTGAQEDFGACKAALAVSVGDPRYLYEAGYSLYGMFGRPFHNREENGSPLLAANHPGLRTWSQLINCRTTADMLGLQCPLPYDWPSSGWSGIDDQHRSHNNANAQLALTGSYALRSVLQDLLQVDLCQQPGFVDTPRAEGRLQMAWANMLMLLDQHSDRQALWGHMNLRLRSLLQTWPGRRFVGDPHHPIRALYVGSSPTFLDPQGNRIPAIVVWEHSIAVMGMFSVYRLTGHDGFRDLAAEVSRLIVNHCIYEENGDWIACTNVRYLQGEREGQPLAPSRYYTGSPDIEIGVDFWEWIFPAVLICRELHRNTDPQLVARCDAIVASLGPPRSWHESEWWAVLPR